MPTYIDFSYGRPGSAAIKAAGHSGVIRYLSRYLPKTLDLREVADYRSGGLAIHVVFEDSANRAVGGWSAGQADAQFAKDQAYGLGWDGSGCIYFAVDFDVTQATQSAVIGYFQGIANVLPVEQVGGYGEADVIDLLASRGLIGHCWQTKAWSGGRVTSRAQMIQLIQTASVVGIDVDVNQVLTPGNTGAWFTNSGANMAGEADAAIVALRGHIAGVNPSDFPTQFTALYWNANKLANDSHRGAATIDQVGEVGAAVAIVNGKLDTLLQQQGTGVDLDVLAEKVSDLLLAKLAAAFAAATHPTA